jgi:O-antigen ligase
MQTALRRLDELAGIDARDRAVAWLERIAFVFLVLMVVAAPHSIAATQTAWITGMFVWIVRLFFKPRVKFRFSALDIALWAFFGWSVITSLTSYAPDISINKLRGVAVFLIFYFVVYNVRSRRAAHLLASTLIASCMVNVLWMPVQRLIGRGVEIHGLAQNGPLSKALLTEGDALLEADGKKLRTPEDVAGAIENNEVTKIKFYRPDFEFVVEVKRGDLLAGGSALERLGISSWKKSRNWRSSGFYGHYATYSEVLQLIASLVFGLLVALWRRGEGDAGGWRRGEEGRGEEGRGEEETPQRGDTGPPVSASPRLRVSPSPVSLLLFCLVAMSLALLLTVTRATQLAFLISAAAIVVVGLGRKWLLAALVVGLPLALIGLLFLQQSREVGFFDTQDDSIKWRQTVWREGYDLWTDNPRHFLLGVGMDSIQRHAAEWHLFDDGRLPMGHFHSTPLNLVVERGLPALLLWLMVLGIYARTMWRALRIPRSAFRTPHSRGIFLGCLGGMIGFVVSGLVHYNLGDQEVAMVFFLLMGIGMKSGESIESGGSGGSGESGESIESGGSGESGESIESAESIKSVGSGQSDWIK